MPILEKTAVSSEKGAKRSSQKAKTIPKKYFIREKKLFLPQNRQTEIKKTGTAENIFFGALHLLAGFLFGSTEIYSLHPCGTAFILASGKYTFLSYIGSCLAVIGYPDDMAFVFAVNSLAFFCRGFLTSFIFDEKRKQKLVVSGAISLISGSVIALVGSFSPLYLSKGILLSLILPCATFSLSAPKYVKKGKNLAINGSFCSACFLCVFALSQINFEKFPPAFFVSAPLILFCSVSGGSIYGLLMGLLLGIACSGADLSAVYALSLGIAGFMAGMGRKNKKFRYVLSFVTSFCTFLTLISGKIDSGILLATAVGAVLFLPLFEFVPHLFVNENPIFSPPSAISGKRERLSKAFSAMSDVVYNVGDKLRYPTEAETRETVRNVMNGICAKCGMNENCYALKIYKNENIEDVVCERLIGGGLEKTDYPEKYASACIKLTEAVEKLNKSYADIINDRFRNNKTEILASEYSSMARLIKYTSQKEKTDTEKDPLLEEKARRALASIGVRFNGICAYGKRMKTIDVFGVRADKFPCTSAELSEYMSEKCGFLFSEPEFIGFGKNMTMRLKRARKIKLEYARCGCAKGSCGVNGDSVNFFESDEDYFYALISDGMGSGRSAALTSRLTSVFLEKLLTSGTHKNVTLEMLNNLLLSKNDESFATVDLLEIDLLTGDACFIKAGAAPAYIIRASKLYKIASCTPPAGIVRSFSAESTKFVLRKGDHVLMLSDGIVQNCDDAPWLCEMLTANDSDPSGMCERILSKAKKINLRDDDMTCAAIRVM